jgi:mRNA-degrading endonuclease RelE of RelBE toxin-antitoxin system
MIAPPGPPGPPAPGFPRVLVYASAALRRLRKLPAEGARALVAALEAYAATGAGDVRRLVDVRPPRYRLRAGDYRAVFALTGTGAEAAVDVEWVGDRRDAY